MEGKQYWTSVGVARVFAACEWRAQRDAPLVRLSRRPAYTVADMMAFWTNIALARWHQKQEAIAQAVKLYGPQGQVIPVKTVQE